MSGLRVRDVVAAALLLAAAVRPLAAQADTTRRPPTPPDSVRPAPPTVRAPVAAPAAAPAPDDSVTRARALERQRADSVRADSLRQAILADTIKSPLARYEMPRNVELTERLRFSREQILGSGAINLADLLDRVPGVTTYRSGWIPGLHAASFHGDGARLRLFLDGIEQDPIGARNREAEDLTDIPLWTLDELVVERAAGEIRVWMRTSTVTSTTPYTRVDIFTGDLNTNAFRGFLARRWRNGLSLQLGGQQVATQTGRVSAFTPGSTTRQRSDGTVQGFTGRLGWSRGRLSVDVYAQNVSRDRDGHTARNDAFDDLPSYKGQRREGYARVGWGDTTRGLWSQVMVHALRTRLDLPAGAPADLDGDGTNDPPVDPDTITGRTQQVAAVGYRTDRWAVSFTDRVRVGDGGRRHAPSVRAHATLGMLTVGAWAEQTGRDSTDRRDLFARLQPLRWFRVAAAYGSRTPDADTERPSSASIRTEAAVRLRNLWAGGGIVRDDPFFYRNITLIGLPSAPLASSLAEGVLGSVTGRLYKDLHLDVQVIRWGNGMFNRPRTHVRTELALISEWRSRFPKGQFSVNARLMFDRREGVPFLYGQGGDGADTRVTEVAQVATGLLEIRIQRGTLFYQYRNLTGGAYEQIRGINMPPAVQMYGVRWEFFN